MKQTLSNFETDNRSETEGSSERANHSESVDCSETLCPSDKSSHGARTTVHQNGHCAHPTPPMVLNEVARLFHGRMRSYDLDGVMSQDSARLLMRALSHGADGGSQLELVRITHLKPPTVSVTLKRMEEAGLVRRESNPMDQRAVRVFLTETGHKHNRAIHARLQALDTVLMRGFSEAEREELLSYLLRMRENILSETPQNDT